MLMGVGEEVVVVGNEGGTRGGSQGGKLAVVGVFDVAEVFLAGFAVVLGYCGEKRFKVWPMDGGNFAKNVFGF